MIYATTDTLTAEQWGKVIESADTVRRSSGGTMVVKWQPPTPAELGGLTPMTQAEAVALMQSPAWQGGQDG